MTGLKTNERPGTRAVLRHSRMSASKARQVLDLIRGEDVDRAAEILRTTERSAAGVIGGVLASAVANAVHNDGQDAEDLYVSACFADEGATLKRWRPRARGRATRIRKRSCHITIIVSRLPDERLARRRAHRDAMAGSRSRRVAGSRRRADLAGRLARRRAAQAEAEDAAARAEAEQAEARAEAEQAEAQADVEETATQPRPSIPETGENDPESAPESEPEPEPSTEAATAEPKPSAEAATAVPERERSATAPDEEGGE